MPSTLLSKSLVRVWITSHGTPQRRCISSEEMKGCRAVQAPVPKIHVENWKPKDDDQDFKRDGDFFLSGIGDGSLDTEPLKITKRVRHGLAEVIIDNISDDDT